MDVGVAAPHPAQGDRADEQRGEGSAPQPGAPEDIGCPSVLGDDHEGAEDEEQRGQREQDAGDGTGPRDPEGQGVEGEEDREPEDQHPHAPPPDEGGLATHRLGAPDAQRPADPAARAQDGARDPRSQRPRAHRPGGTEDDESQGQPPVRPSLVGSESGPSATTGVNERTRARPPTTQGQHGEDVAGAGEDGDVGRLEGRPGRPGSGPAAPPHHPAQPTRRGRAPRRRSGATAS